MKSKQFVISFSQFCWHFFHRDDALAVVLRVVVVVVRILLLLFPPIVTACVKCINFQFIQPIFYLWKQGKTIRAIFFSSAIIWKDVTQFKMSIYFCATISQRLSEKCSLVCCILYFDCGVSSLVLQLSIKSNVPKWKLCCEVEWHINYPPQTLECILLHLTGLGIFCVCVSLKTEAGGRCRRNEFIIFHSKLFVMLGLVLRMLLLS